MIKQVVYVVALMALVAAEELLVERKVPAGAFIASDLTNVGNPELWREEHSYAAEDGTTREETLYFKRVNDELVPVMTGRFAFLDVYGRKYEVQFVADENGFQPVGEHLPKPAEEVPLAKEDRVDSVPFFSSTTTTTQRPVLPARKPFLHSGKFT